MKKILYILLFIATNNTFSEELIFIDSIKLPKDFSNVFIDENKNIYNISDDNKFISKIYKDNIISYENFIMGDISYLSILNNNYFIVFFENFNGVEFLSKKLKRRNFLDFNNSPKLTPNLISGSKFYNLWIYEEDKNKLIYYNSKDKKEIFRTEELFFIYGRPFKPKKLVSTQTRVWAIAKNGIIEINNRGDVTNIFRYSNILNVFKFKDFIGFLLKDKIVLKNDTSIVEIKTKFGDYKKIFVYNKKLFVVYKSYIKEYSISKE